LGQGLKINILSRPFVDGGPYFQPGVGSVTVVTQIGEQRLQTRRDLEVEKSYAEEVIAACPTLSALHDDGQEDLMEWQLENPEDCLEVLTELKGLGERVTIEWPEGQSFFIQQQVDSKQLHLKIKKRQDWFDVSGELQVDNDLVLSMQKLLELTEQAKGRFIPLEDGNFLELTKKFRKRLDKIKAYSIGAGRIRKFHPLSILILDNMHGEFGRISSDHHWKAHLKRLKQAQVFQPELPSTFKAQLRDYQMDGFTWLARLNHWGAGACLADDMGLGKTIQALSVILVNASNGPSLVVAPTSVCLNWELEVKRFAPTLNTVFLSNGNRKKIINQLNAFDLLVVSYGLLQQKRTADLLKGVMFQTIVLDEAQAIKNVSTKRSKAAMQLNGCFKLITTGTPIENNLLELWNLFQFINPGLLGPLDGFNHKFALPIEKDQDKTARRRLKRLIQPFILRRTKEQVLEELPPRTDITLQVELSKEEKAFYEALRLQALEHLAKKDGLASQNHLKILAEIMKLRRACCSTSLVDPTTKLASAKLVAFGDVVEDLIAGGHKALVFSQFVGHLALIKAQVEKKGISYQYLDGSTPTKERQKRVNAFQAGNGDLFLISLKAGGLGLNLTAADYVIHMDPWWNPAVEDQAADRAHRIGQKRPVTVYRLITRHTIEEKIVALHKTKRDLADSLLEGADMSGKISAQELLNLIQTPI
jgi:SNF2 family DNA or RNA helicase